MKICILLKGKYSYSVQKEYLDFLSLHGVINTDIELISLPYPEGTKGKINVKFIKEQLEPILQDIKELGCNIIYCADANYFKVLTKQTKAEVHLGYKLPCVFDENIDVVLGINIQSLIFNPANRSKLTFSLSTLVQVYKNEPLQLSIPFLKDERYPITINDIAKELLELLREPILTCDIETYSLYLKDARLATIAFSKDAVSGVAFAVDRGEIPKETRKLLKEFFEYYKGELIFHGSTYDTKVLIYELWMEHPLDYVGLLKGLEVMYRKTHDTRMLAFLCLNSTAKVSLRLKDLVHEYAGNYAQDDIKDTTKIPLPELLTYNLIDSAATFWAYNKYSKLILKEEQLNFYLNHSMPAQKLITQLELTGMPMDANKISEAKKQLQELIDTALESIAQSPIINKVEDVLTDMAWNKDYLSRKGKAKNPAKIFPKDKKVFPRVIFNSGSGKQLGVLLFGVLGLEPVDKTATGNPSTDSKSLKKIKLQTSDPNVLELLDSITGLSKAQKIVSTFITAFENGFIKDDDRIWLHGSFNQGVVPSGRMASSGPNMQNLPSGSKYGKLVKKCFVPPKGWIMVGADFNALEDRISALLTRDPSKLIVFINDIDSHSYNAYVYWPEEFPDITEDTINKIVGEFKDKYAAIRSRSKTVTFALLYGGTAHTLVNKSGFSWEEAHKVLKNYLNKYVVSTEYYAKRKQEACDKGHTLLAFGLKLRTPLLKQSILGSKATLQEAEAEGRTLGNAATQSYGILNTRAAVAFMNEVRDSPYKYDIKPIALIHDAIYLVIKEDINVIEWVNTNLIKHMNWQDLPELQHDSIKLKTDMEVFYPDWSNAIGIPNNAQGHEIIDLVKKNLKKDK